MDKNRRKELVNEYINTKTEMGVYTFECKATGKHYIGTTQNTKATLNGSKFRLGAGNHKIQNLQSDWKQYGEDNFDVRVLDVLEYDKDDEMKDDYSVELEILLEKWVGSFENVEVIN